MGRHGPGCAARISSCGSRARARSKGQPHGGNWHRYFCCHYYLLLHSICCARLPSPPSPCREIRTHRGNRTVDSGVCRTPPIARRSLDGGTTHPGGRPGDGNLQERLQGRRWICNVTCLRARCAHPLWRQPPSAHRCNRTSVGSQPRILQAAVGVRDEILNKLADVACQFCSAV